MVAQGGGSALGTIFASAAASADVRPAPCVAVAETAAVAAVAVVAFAAVTAMVGIAAVAIILLTTASSQERPFTRAFLSMCFVAFSAMFASN